MRRALAASLLLTILVLSFGPAEAKNPIRQDFFARYPGLVGTVVETVPSNTNHCGMCHYDFNGGGPRNDFGSRVEYYRGLGNSSDQAFALLESEDSDSDGVINIDELTDLATYANTPTFPGLDADDGPELSNVTVTEVSPHFVPTAAVDTNPPVVTVITPAGGAYDGRTTDVVEWTAVDDMSGIAVVDIYFSDDNGTSWRPVALGLADTGTSGWIVPNRPGTQNLIRVTAIDGAGNPGNGLSTPFTINAQTGIAPTTFRDMDLPGTQPLEGPDLANPDTNCATCHGNYDPAVEPWANWRGSMMSQAARDPIFYACLAVAEQDAPSVGDLCIRCHSPRGWLLGRSVDTSGNSLTAEDRVGISCDFCHKLVDPDYKPGISPPQDADILAGLDVIPAQSGNGEFVMATNAEKRGPYSDALDVGHPVQESPFHTTSDICGTCHDVSSPVFDNLGGGDYAPNAFDAPHASFVTQQMGPIERTYSEWKNSDFAQGDVDVPAYGPVSTCQDCHMVRVTGAGCNDPGAPIRTDLPLHDFTGGNTFMPLLIADAYPGEVDPAQLNAAIDRARATLQKAARIELTPDPAGVNVRVYNDTGHKLPSGYPEGRRIWLNVVAKDDADQVVYTSGDYDLSTGVLDHDADLKIYEIKPGLSPGLAGVLGLPSGPSFHFVLNDSVFFDSRIPPRGFTNAAFEAIQSPPVAHTYADGQYWDDTFYALPNTAATVTVTLYYQSTSKEYVEFLRDENTTNSAGQDLYDGWVAHGRAAPEIMAQETTQVDVLTANDPREHQFSFRLDPLAPNPTSGGGFFAFAMPSPSHVDLAVFDLRGRRVRTIEDEIRPAGRYTVSFDGRDDAGHSLASGVYILRLRAAGQVATQRVTILR